MYSLLMSICWDINVPAISICSIENIMDILMDFDFLLFYNLDKMYGLIEFIFKIETSIIQNTKTKCVFCIKII